MFRKVGLVFAILCLTVTAFAEQICYESQPPQLNLSCEYVSGTMYLRFEVVDVTNSKLIKKDIHMGRTLFGNDEGRMNCDEQLQMLKSSAIGTVIQKPTLVAVCDKSDVNLVRLVLNPQAPYIVTIDKKEIGTLASCISEMDAINSQK